MIFEYETIQPSEQIPIKLFSFEANNIDRIIPKHWHKSAELLYCVEGKLNVWVDAQFYSLNDGDFLFINSNTVHSTQSPTKNKVIVLQIPLSFFQEATKDGYDNGFDICLNTLLEYENNNKRMYFPKIKHILLSMMDYNDQNGLSEKHRNLARKVINKSLVLLKNNNTLSLNLNQKVALTGPYA